MNNKNTLNKIILGAGIVGAIYLSGCKNKTIIETDEIVKEKTDSTTHTTTYINSGNIPLEPKKLTWNNVRLIGKDEGFINCKLGGNSDGENHYQSDSDYGTNYVYSEYLFINPTGETVSLFGKEGTLYIGQNYNIEFYRIKSDIKLTSKIILQTLEDRTPWVNFNQNIDKDIEGILNKYTRVTKQQELTK
jgi:hypothetical protein